MKSPLEDAVALPAGAADADALACALGAAGGVADDDGALADADAAGRDDAVEVVLALAPLEV